MLQQQLGPVGMISLGCAKNRVDSEIMLAKLAEAGYRITPRADQARIIIVNTCGFIQSAKEEAIDTILEMAQYKQDKCRYLIAAGCLTERYADQLQQEMPELDGILGVAQYDQIVPLIARIQAGERVVMVGDKTSLIDQPQRVLTTPSYTAYLKIAEGCDNRCSYCAIPGIRGGYRSRPMDSLVAEARLLAEKGVKELVVIAQDITRYGQDLPGHPHLVDLLDALGEVEGIAWLRLMYAHPTRVDDRLIQWIGAHPKACPYLDLPLQHADDALLQRMNRPYTQAWVREILAKLRATVPDIAIRTSLIVGFPGESEAAFENLMDFIGDARIERAGVFAYSPEEDTPAIGFPDPVPEEVAEARLERLMALQQGISRAYNDSRVGQVVEVMIEGFDEETQRYQGRSRFEAPEVDGVILVEAEDAALEPGQMIRVRLTAAFDYDMLGVMV
ncbi:MAG: 30S ribosomal protein S12 methylthiotransferase RimO [Christensenellales bacterium]|jgi:ribosomal protein S12 methylthiotransferase